MSVMMNREQRRKQAKADKAENAAFLRSSIGMRIEREMRAKEEAMKKLLQQGISPEDLEKEYSRGFDEGYKLAGENVVVMCYAAVCLALHKLHGYGEKRCYDVLQEIDSTILYELTSQDLVKKVYDEMGLELNFKDPFNRVQKREDD